MAKEHNEKESKDVKLIDSVRSSSKGYKFLPLSSFLPRKRKLNLYDSLFEEINKPGSSGIAKSTPKYTENEYKAKIKELHSTVKKQNAKEDEYKSKIEELESKAKGFEMIKEEFKDFREIMGKLRFEARLTEDLNILIEKNERLTEKNNKARQALQRLTEDNERLTENNNKLTEDDNKAKQALQRLTDDNARLTKERDQSFIFSRRKTERILSLTENIARLTKEKEKLRIDCVHNREHIDLLSDELESLKKKIKI